MSKMTIKMAEKIAAAAFGPSAQCKRHNDPRNKDKRFAIYYTDAAQGEAGEKGFLSVYPAGYGRDWESALKMANDNPAAQAKSKQIAEKRKELQRRMAEQEAASPVVKKKSKKGAK
jgi:hypothetical protein